MSDAREFKEEMAHAQMGIKHRHQCAEPGYGPVDQTCAWPRPRLPALCDEGWEIHRGLEMRREQFVGFGASKTSDGVVRDVRYQYIHYPCYVPRCVCYVTHIQKRLLSECFPSATLNRSR